MNESGSTVVSGFRPSHEFAGEDEVEISTQVTNEDGRLEKHAHVRKRDGERVDIMVLGEHDSNKEPSIPLDPDVAKQLTKKQLDATLGARKQLARPGSSQAGYWLTSNKKKGEIDMGTSYNSHFRPRTSHSSSSRGSVAREAARAGLRDNGASRDVGGGQGGMASRLRRPSTSHSTGNRESRNVLSMSPPRSNQDLSGKMGSNIGNSNARLPPRQPKAVPYVMQTMPTPKNMRRRPSTGSTAPDALRRMNDDICSTKKSGVAFKETSTEEELWFLDNDADPLNKSKTRYVEQMKELGYGQPRDVEQGSPPRTYSPVRRRKYKGNDILPIRRGEYYIKKYHRPDPFCSTTMQQQRESSLEDTQDPVWECPIRSESTTPGYEGHRPLHWAYAGQIQTRKERQSTEITPRTSTLRKNLEKQRYSTRSRNQMRGYESAGFHDTMLPRGEQSFELMDHYVHNVLNKDLKGDKMLRFIMKKIQSMAAGDRFSAKDLFQKMDKNGSGYVTKKEFQQVLRRMKVHLQDHEIGHVLLKMDTDRDGKVSYEEFTKTFLNY